MVLQTGSRHGLSVLTLTLVSSLQARTTRKEKVRTQPWVLQSGSRQSFSVLTLTLVSRLQARTTHLKEKVRRHQKSGEAQVRSTRFVLHHPPAVLYSLYLSEVFRFLEVRTWRTDTNKRRSKGSKDPVTVLSRLVLDKAFRFLPSRWSVGCKQEQEAKRKTSVSNCGTVD